LNLLDKEQHDVKIRLQNVTVVRDDAGLAA
jgi:hypothetical protein